MFPLNASIIISVAPEYANSDSLKKVSKELKRNEIVQDVDYPEFIVKSVSNNFKKIQWIILGVTAVFMLISMLLIANCIRLNIYAKRFNIKWSRHARGHSWRPRPAFQASNRRV